MNDLEEELAKLEVQRGILREVKRNIDLENTGVVINKLLPILAGSVFEFKLEKQIIALQDLVQRRNNQLTTATSENLVIVLLDRQIENQKTSSFAAWMQQSKSSPMPSMLPLKRSKRSMPTSQIFRLRRLNMSIRACLQLQREILHHALREAHRIRHLRSGVRF